jgi:hypothetical protein
VSAILLISRSDVWLPDPVLLLLPCNLCEICGRERRMAGPKSKSSPAAGKHNGEGEHGEVDPDDAL